MDGFLGFMEAQSLPLYTNTAHGTLLLRLPAEQHGKHSDGAGASMRSGEPIALISEHRMFDTRQRTLRFDGGREAAMRLPAGDYSVAVTMPGYAPFRAFVTIEDGKTNTIEARLDRAQAHEHTLADILTRNHVPDPSRQARNLVLAQGQTLVLDEDRREHHQDLVRVELKTMEALKAVLGTPDSLWVGSHARFGRSGYSRDHKIPDMAKGNLTDDQRAAMQEWIYGNSRSVARWASFLSDWIAQESISVGLYVLHDVTVGPHATLDVKAGGLLCNTLSVHYTGNVRFVGHGPGKIEMNNYVRYGLLDVNSVVSKAGYTPAHLHN